MKFGVIGAGEIGGLRVASLRDHPDTQVVAVADVSEAHAKRVAGPVGARAVTEWRTLLDAADIDVVVISTPLPLHEEMAAAALEAGKHVLIEKPLANTLEGCRRLVDLSRTTGRALGVGFNHRFYPSVKFLTQVIEEGTLGELDHVRAYGGHDGLPSLKEEWMYEYPAAGGGAMWDVGIHITDLVRYIAGELTEVYGVVGNRIWNLGESEDNAMAIFKGERNLPVIYQASWSEWAGYHWYVDVYGTQGHVPRLLRTHVQPARHAIAARWRAQEAAQVLPGADPAREAQGLAVHHAGDVRRRARRVPRDGGGPAFEARERMGWPARQRDRPRGASRDGDGRAGPALHATRALSAQTRTTCHTTPATVPTTLPNNSTPPSQSRLSVHQSSTPERAKSTSPIEVRSTMSAHAK